MDFMDTVLIVGGGGREHAIQKALLRSDRALCLFAYPGNAGMESDGCMSVDTEINSWNDLADWAVSNEVDLAVIGPELPLTEGIANIFNKRGIKTFGPSQKAAQIEGSKEFSKNLMQKYSIPTADFEVFEDKESALKYLEEKGAPIVVKASGLAGGKGAIVCETLKEAQDAVSDMFSNRFGDAGSTVVIEEKMFGEEASVFVLSDGKNYKILPVSQDHKAIYDGDKGPNTGGMGAYAPAPVVDEELLLRVEKEIVVPTLDAMRNEGAVYKGLLYVGIMITEDGPKVVEYNCRFGDPETEAVLPLVSCDWFDVFSACADGELDQVEWDISKGYCATVVMVSEGYPGKYETGKKIEGLSIADHFKANVDVYHAGTKRGEGDEILTNGGRVLAVSAIGESLQDAIADAYEAVSEISFENAVFRKDIGLKGVKRLAGEK